MTFARRFQSYDTLLAAERISFRIQQTISFLRVLDRAHKGCAQWQLDHDVQLTLDRLNDRLDRDIRSLSTLPTHLQPDLKRE
jgi:hypothetical protein